MKIRGVEDGNESGFWLRVAVKIFAALVIFFTFNYNLDRDAIFWSPSGIFASIIMSLYLGLYWAGSERIYSCAGLK